MRTARSCPDPTLPPEAAGVTSFLPAPRSPLAHGEGCCAGREMTRVSEAHPSRALGCTQLEKAL